MGYVKVPGGSEPTDRRSFALARRVATAGGWLCASSVVTVRVVNNRTGCASCLPSFAGVGGVCVVPGGFQPVVANLSPYVITALTIPMMNQVQVRGPTLQLNTSCGVCPSGWAGSTDCATNACPARPQVHHGLRASSAPGRISPDGAHCTECPAIHRPLLHQIAQSVSSARSVTSVMQACATNAFMESNLTAVAVPVNRAHLGSLG